MNITARDIRHLLMKRAESQRHIFFDEVTDYGRSVLGHQSRIDAIAIKPAYSKIQIWGYEIKVSRQDFVQDEKWHQYLEMCNNLYFVCPHGVIKKDEVPADAGLIYVHKNGTGMRTVKKAPYRTVTYRPVYFLGMILNKLGLMDKSEFTREERIARVKRSMELEQDALTIGRMLRSSLAHELSATRERQERIEKKIKELEDVRDFLRSEGVIVDVSGRQSWTHRTALDSLKQRKDQIVQDPEMDRLINTMKQTQNSLTRAMSTLETARAQANNRTEKARDLFPEDDDETELSHYTY